MRTCTWYSRLGPGGKEQRQSTSSSHPFFSLPGSGLEDNCFNTCNDDVIVEREDEEKEGKEEKEERTKQEERRKKKSQEILRGINQLLQFPDAASLHRLLVNKPLEKSKR